MRHRLWVIAAMLLAAVGMLLGGCGGSFGPTLPSPPTVFVTGRVIDASTGGGVAGATVTIGGQTATTDGEGFYQFTDLATGDSSVTVVPPAGYVTAGPPDAVRIALGPNEVGGIYLAPDAQAPPSPPSL